MKLSPNNRDIRAELDLVLKLIREENETAQKIFGGAFRRGEQRNSSESKSESQDLSKVKIHLNQF